MVSIITVPAFSDNYIWLICDENEKVGLIVDPGDPRQLLKILEEKEIEPIAVLLTHLHYDHANGLKKLTDRYPELPIYGPRSEYELLKENPNPPTYGPATNCFKYLTHLLDGDETLDFNQIHCSFKVMNIPGHTSGHIAYHDKNNKSLFCGDTVFAGGCGRIFNGSYKKLHDSLHTIAQLPNDTLIYCAHEYTLDNLGFAEWVEPESKAVKTRIDADRALIDSDQATVPSLLSLELETNPFFRTSMPLIIKKVEDACGKSLNNSTEVFTEMRIWKDTAYD